MSTFQTAVDQLDKQGPSIRSVELIKTALEAGKVTNALNAAPVATGNKVGTADEWFWRFSFPGAAAGVDVDIVLPAGFQIALVTGFFAVDDAMGVLPTASGDGDAVTVTFTKVPGEGAPAEIHLTPAGIGADLDGGSGWITFTRP